MALRIGQVAKTSGIPARTIRFYETAGVLPAPGRTASGYRQYTADAVQQPRFVRRARMLGLSLPYLTTLMVTLDGGGRQAMRGRMREVIRAQLSAVQARMRELRLLERELHQVLRRIKTSRPNGRAGHCRCLEPAGTTAAIRRRAARQR